MRLATWNVNSIHARLGHLLAWLAARQPDVVCLQELKVAPPRLPQAELEAAGYRCLAHGEPRWNGVAILSRREATLLQAGLPGAEAAGARLIVARVGELSVGSVYVPNGKSIEHADYQAKLVWLDRLCAWLREADWLRGAAVLGGDFNIAPADLDTSDPAGLAGQLHHSEAERAALGRLLGLGLHDLFRTRHPGAQGFSWWDYRGGAFHRNQGMRLDLLLGSSAVLEQTSEIWIDREFRKRRAGFIPSDHAPVVAEMRGW
ncbi:MAG: exodeoxyribonuclease III [Deltaproteobacteria bacterium]|nr:exodeoxyribonuclease III [Deltaproteobacteria bacterium]